MPIFTPEEIAEQKTAYKKALMALSTSQEYAIGKRRLVRADLPEIRNTLAFLEEEERKLSGTSGPVMLAGRPVR